MMRRSRFIPTPLISFGDASHGWLVFGGVTWRTSDGGTGWVRG